MKKIVIVLTLVFCMLGCVKHEVTIKDFDFVKGCFPSHIDKMLGNPEYEFVRGYFYREERHFWWHKKGVWIYIGFWPDQYGNTTVGNFGIYPEPKLGLQNDNSTSGPHIIIKIKEHWLPFKKEFPKEYLKQLTNDDLKFMEQYMPQSGEKR